MLSLSDWVSNSEKTRCRVDEVPKRKPKICDFEKIFHGWVLLGIYSEDISRIVTVDDGLQSGTTDWADQLSKRSFC